MVHDNMPPLKAAIFGLLAVFWLVATTTSASAPAFRRRILPPPLRDTYERENERRKTFLDELQVNMHRIAQASKQFAIHIASSAGGPTPDFVELAAVIVSPRNVLGLSAIASCFAARHLYKKSEGAQRACSFWKKAGPIVAHYKWTQWWLKTTKAPIEKRHAVFKSLHDRYCQPSLEIALDLKGLYVKMGQVMSSRSDFLPVQYIELFCTLQDSIPQWPIEEAVDIVRETLKNERDLDYEDVFETIDPVALGCASIGQVHRAVLKDPWVNADPDYNGGKVVALKIMHPDARKRFACDFQVFKWLTRVAMPGWRPLMEELERRLMTEFDYRNEARNQVIVRDNMMKSPYRRRVTVPETYKGLTCKHVLVMEMLDGRKLTDAIEDKLSGIMGGDRERAANFLAQRQLEVLHGGASEPSKKDSIFDLLNIHGITGVYRAWKALSLYRKVNSYINLLLDVHGHQIFQAAAFNGDPHPGNILELSDGRLGLIDFGQTKFLSDDERLGYARVVADVGRKADVDRIAESMRLAGFRTKLDVNENLAEYAGLFFDSDHVSKEKGFSTPQHYFQTLMAEDPLTSIPDASIMVARVSILFRGVGSAMHHQVQTCDHWKKHAEKALRERNQ